jgi:hypothetical protein
MRLIPLWVILYAIILGPALSIPGFWLFVEFAFSYSNRIAWDVGQIASIVSILLVMAGFWVLFSGFVLLLKSGKFSSGRVVSLIGIWAYYIAALGVVLAGAMYGYQRLETWEIVIIPASAVCVFLLGFFIMRKFRCLQEAESIKT